MVRWSWCPLHWASPPNPSMRKLVIEPIIKIPIGSRLFGHPVVYIEPNFCYMNFRRFMYMGINTGLYIYRPIHIFVCCTVGFPLNIWVAASLCCIQICREERNLFGLIQLKGRSRWLPLPSQSRLELRPLNVVKRLKILGPHEPWSRHRPLPEQAVLTQDNPSRACR
jgi:hypothetical protein